MTAFFIIISTMERKPGRIYLNYTDPEINALIKRSSSGSTDGIQTGSRHYTQNEEFFLKLDHEYFVPSFPIHHDVRNHKPTRRYIDTLKILMESVIPLAPELFAGLTYFFDPADTLRPSFFQLYRLGESHYLYLLKLDLSYKASEHEVVQAGTNDATAEYRSSKLFLDGIVVPLDQVDTDDGRVSSFGVKQTVSQTWIGETGRGYFVQGIWMDHELTKFFSKLFVPADKRMYPYYPFQCRYRTICSTVIGVTAEERKQSPRLLHRAVQFVQPVMDFIQDSLRDTDFSTDLKAFQELKRRVPEYWNGIWNGITITPYLNQRDMKEFKVEL